LGQVVQPRPDWLSRTAPPVAMMAAYAITPASAILRMASRDGFTMTSVHRTARARQDRPAAG
jgi:hypothetical protein